MIEFVEPAKVTNVEECSDWQRKRFADPLAAASEHRRQEAMANVIRAATAELSPEQVGMLAALLATSYVSSSGPNAAITYHRELIANGASDQLADEAIDALMCQALYGRNGSDALRAASSATEWRPMPGDM